MPRDSHMQRLRYSTIPAVTLGLGGLAPFLGAMPVLAQSRPQIPTAVPRAPDGKPDMSGLWQAFNTANWDLLDHAGRQAAIIEGGAAFAVPPGVGGVEGNAIPYQPWAEAKKKEKGANWLKLSVPDFSDARPRPFRLRVRRRQPHDLLEQQGGQPGRQLDGDVEWPLGRRHACGRRGRIQRSVVV
mgnify:CR=1 FL=1